MLQAGDVLHAGRKGLEVTLPGVPINVDLKQQNPSMVGPLLKLLRAYDAEERVLIASFRSATVAEVRRLGYAGRTALGQSEAVGALQEGQRVADLRAGLAAPGRLLGQEGVVRQETYRLEVGAEQ